MDIITFSLSTENIAFTVAYSLILAFLVIEVVSLIIGFGFSQAIDSATSDMFDVDVDVAIDPDLSSVSVDGAGFNFLHWIGFGKMPFMAVVTSFLVCFGSVGWIIQLISLNWLGVLLPGWLALVAFPISLFPTRYLCVILAKIIPRDTSSAIDQSSFLWNIATITIGTAKSGMPAEAKFTDKYGQIHYVMVEPADSTAEFVQGKSVVLTSRVSDKHFLAR